METTVFVISAILGVIFCLDAIEVTAHDIHNYYASGSCGTGKNSIIINIVQIVVNLAVTFFCAYQAIVGLL